MKTNNAEGGSNTVTPTSSDTGSVDAFTTVTKGANSILQYSTSHPAHGALGYKLGNHTATAEANWFGWDNGSTIADAYGRFYVYWDGTPSAATQLIHMRTSGGTVIAIVQASAALKLLGLDGASATQFTSTTTFSINTTYRIEWRLNFVSGTTWNLRLLIYAGDATSATEDSGTISITATPVNFQQVRYGRGTGTAANWPSSTASVYFDDLVAFAAGLPGPAGKTGASAMALADAITTSGVRTALGTTAMALADAITTSGVRKTFGVTTMSLADAITTSGVRKTFGVSTVALADVFTTSGVRKALGVSTFTLTDAISTAGVRTAEGASSFALTDMFTTSGVRTAKGASTMSLVDVITSSGVRTAMGASSMGLHYDVTTSGSKNTFGAVDATFFYAPTTAGIRTLFGSTAMTIPFDITTAGGLLIYGSLVYGLTYAVSTSGEQVLPAATGGAITFAREPAGVEFGESGRLEEMLVGGIST